MTISRLGTKGENKERKRNGPCTRKVSAPLRKTPILVFPFHSYSLGSDVATLTSSLKMNTKYSNMLITKQMLQNHICKHMGLEPHYTHTSEGCGP